MGDGKQFVSQSVVFYFSSGLQYTVVINVIFKSQVFCISNGSEMIHLVHTVICEQDYLPYEGHFTITFNASLETALHWVFVMLQQIYCRLFYLIFMLSLRKDYSFCSYFTCGMNGTRCEEWSRRESQDHRSPVSVCEIPSSSALNTDQERNQGRISYFRAFWGQQWTERATDSRNTFPLRREALAVRSRTLFMLEHFATVHILPECLWTTCMPDVYRG